MFRMRKMTDNMTDPRRVGGDFVFGHGIQCFQIDSPTAVAQAILTRLRLWQGEWFLALNLGVPYLQQILGHTPSANIPDGAIRSTIANTPFVRLVTDYASSFNSTSRHFTVSCKVQTAFGPVTQAPPGALISPDNHLVIPLSVHPSVQIEEPIPQITSGRRVVEPPPRRLPSPPRRLEAPRRMLTRR